MHWRQYQELQKVAEIGSRYLSYVDRGSGPPVVLLHGMPTWGYLWSGLLPSLERTRRALVPDLLGFGFSDRRDRFDRSISRQAEAVAAWMAKLGVDSADMVGHDIGGGVALRLAAFFPRLVERLVLIDSVCYDSWPIELMLQLGHPGTHRRLSARALSRVVSLALKGGAINPQAETLEGLLAPYSTEEGKLSLIRAASALDTNLTMELVPHLPKLRVPTLILWGEDDPFQPLEYGRRLARDLPKARLAVVSRARHFVLLDQPQETAAQLETFLVKGR